MYRTKEYRQKMSKITSGKNNGMYGRKHSEESKNKMSINKKGKKCKENNPMYGKKDEKAINGKKIAMLNDDFEIVKEFVSVKCALSFLGMKGHSDLYKAIKNNYKYKGYY